MFETTPVEPAPPAPAPPLPTAPERGPSAAAPELAPWSASSERPAFMRPTPEQGNTSATTSLIFAVVGLLFVVGTLGAAFIVSLPCSIAAWVIGVQGRRQVASGATKVGDGVAHAGLILGIVGVVLSIIGAVVWFLIFASVDFDVDRLRQELEQDR
jgi:hypothetical protein